MKVFGGGRVLSPVKWLRSEKTKFLEDNLPISLQLRYFLIKLMNAPTKVPVPLLLDPIPFGGIWSISK